MSESLFSSVWYRVADLRPRLGSHAQLHFHNYRGRDWYVLQDHLTGRFHRLSPQAFHVVALMDGKRSLKDIWSAACANLGDDIPTQDEVISLLAQLHRADVLRADMPPDISDLHRRYVHEKKSSVLNWVRSPMAVRFPLIDPERFLRAVRRPVNLFFGWPGLVLWFSLVVPALFLAGVHWVELTSNLTDRVMAAENLFLLWLVYPVIKALHEMGHACAVKRWGGEVHEMGIMLLVLMPIPYVDASASLAYREKWRRMIVSASGVMVELLLAAIALFVWLNVHPGPVRTVAFNVMLVAGVSTLLFNGNPLLRFDAYYILADFLEIPNLGSQSNRYFGYLVNRFLFHIGGLESPASSPGEAFWLSVYGPASFVYRIFISFRIALFVSGKFFVIGVILALWVLFNMIVMPLFKVFRRLFTEIGARGYRRRVLLISGGLVLGGIVFSARVPVPSYTVAEGVVSVPKKACVMAGCKGFISSVEAEPGQEVKAGDSLIRLSDPEIDTMVKEARARLKEAEARLRSILYKDQTEVEIIRSEIVRINGEIVRMEEKQKESLVTSPADGFFVLPRFRDLPGQFVRQGTLLGYVIDESNMIVHVVVPQSDVAKARGKTRRVTARLAGSIKEVRTARIIRVVPAAMRKLPSMTLSLEGGGRIALDPREQGRPEAFENFFQFEMELQYTGLNLIGERVYVRFEYDPEPLIFRWYNSIRRLLLKRFEV